MTDVETDGVLIAAGFVPVTNEPGTNGILELLASAVREAEAEPHSLLSMEQNGLPFIASERSICHRVAMYLERGMPGMPEDMHWYVDCEYNRVHGEGQTYDDFMAKARRLKPDAENGKSLVLPDIIVHQRVPKSNWLVVEAKVSCRFTADQLDNDIVKLQQFKYGKFHYEEAVFILFHQKGSKIYRLVGAHPKKSERTAPAQEINDGVE